MKITVDSNGYAENYAVTGNLAGGLEVEMPEAFEESFRAYRLVNGELILDPERKESLLLEMQKDRLRRRRETECFPVVNRGNPWYDFLAPAQREELVEWYHMWLDVTETLQPPEPPAFLTDGTLLQQKA